MALSPSEPFRSLSKGNVCCQKLIEQSGSGAPKRAEDPCRVLRWIRGVSHPELNYSLLRMRSCVNLVFSGGEVRVRVGAGRVSFEKLSRCHGIKIAPEVNCSVEDCSLAVGEIVGYNSVVSACRMSGAVVVFLDEVEKVNMMVQNGVVVQGTFMPLRPSFAQRGR
ncbi:hypothetical protein SRHO_G00153990 [Serrasalmus rhombeus]